MLSGFCAITVSIFEEHDYKLHCYSGENVISEVYNYLNQEEQRISTILNQNKAIIELTEEQHNSHEMATKSSAQSDPRRDISATLPADIWSGLSVV